MDMENSGKNCTGVFGPKRNPLESFLASSRRKSTQFGGCVRLNQDSSFAIGILSSSLRSRAPSKRPTPPTVGQYPSDNSNELNGDKHSNRATQMPGISA